MFNSTFKKIKQKKSYTLPYKMNTEDEVSFDTAYPEYTLNFSSTIYHPHAAAANSRILERHLLKELVGYTALSGKISIPDQVLLLDIGGNFMHHIDEQNNDIHCCSPILSHYDAKRKAERKIQAEMKMVTCKNQETKEILKRFLYGDKMLDCGKKIQDCVVRGRFAISIHACYDIDLHEFCSGLYSKGVEIAIATMIFTPDMLKSNTGQIPELKCDYSISTENDNIEFAFVGDSSYAYKHKFSSYLEYFTISYVVANSAYGYTIEMLGCRLGVQFLKFTRVEHIHNLEVPVHRLWFSDCANKSVVTYYTYESSLSVLTRRYYLIPKAITVDNDMLNMIMTYTFRLEDNRFIPKNVHEYANSINNTIVINGKAIKKKVGLSAPELYELCHAIYIHVYELKYLVGKVDQELIDVIKADRKMNSKSLLASFFDYVVKLFKFNICDLSAKTLALLRSRSKDPDNSMFVKIEPAEKYKQFDHSLDKTSIFDLFRNHKMLESNHLIRDVVFKRNLTVQDMLVTDLSDFLIHDEDTDALTPLRAFIPEVITNFNMDKPEVEFNLSPQDQMIYDLFHHGSDLTEEESMYSILGIDENPGNGDCLYYAMSHIQPKNLRMLLADSEKLRFLRDSDAIRNVLLTEGSWGNRSIVDLYAMTFGVAVVVVADEATYRYGPKTSSLRNASFVRYTAGHYRRMNISYDGQFNSKLIVTRDIYNLIDLIKNQLSSNDWLVKGFATANLIGLKGLTVGERKVEFQPFVDTSSGSGEKFFVIMILTEYDIAALSHRTIVNLRNVGSSGAFVIIPSSQLESFFLKFVVYASKVRMYHASQWIGIYVEGKNTEITYNMVDDFQKYTQFIYETPKSSRNIYWTCVDSKPNRVSYSIPLPKYMRIPGLSAPLEIEHGDLGLITKRIRLMTSNDIVCNLGSRKLNLKTRARVIIVDHLMQINTSTISAGATTNDNTLIPAIPQRSCLASIINTIRRAISSKIIYLILSEGSDVDVPSLYQFLTELSSIPNLKVHLFTVSSQMRVLCDLFFLTCNRHTINIDSEVFDSQYRLPMNTERKAFQNLPDKDYTAVTKMMKPIINKTMYLNNAHSKLLQILQKFSLTYNSFFDIAGAPGGFAKALMEWQVLSEGTMHYYFDVNKEKHLKPILPYNARLKMLDVLVVPSWYKGDLNCVKTRAYLATMPRVDLVTGDACSLAGLESEENIQLIGNEVNVALSLLKVGGSLIVKIGEPYLYSNLLKKIIHSFLYVDLYKPLNSNPLSPETYIVARVRLSDHRECVSSNSVAIFKKSVDRYYNQTYLSMLKANHYVNKLKQDAPTVEDLDNAEISSSVNGGDSPLDSNGADLPADQETNNMPNAPPLHLADRTSIDSYDGVDTAIDIGAAVHDMLSAPNSEDEDTLNINQVIIHSSNQETLENAQNHLHDTASVSSQDSVVKSFTTKSSSTEVGFGQLQILHPISTLHSAERRGRDTQLNRYFSPTAEVAHEGVSTSVKQLITARNSLREVVEMWRVTDKSYLDVMRQLYCRYSVDVNSVSSLACNAILAARTKDAVGIIDNGTGKWVVKTQTLPETYTHAYDGTNFITLKKKHLSQTTITPNLCSDSPVNYLMVSSCTEVMLASRLYQEYRNVDPYTLTSFPKIIREEGVPGCGKTHRIVSQVDVNRDLVLSVTQDGKENMRERLMRKEKGNDLLDSTCLTLSSYLLNHRGSTFERVFIDEALMCHPGEIWLVVLSTKCKELYLIGDSLQIEYFSRVPGIPLRFHLLDYIPVTNILSVSYRCPVDVASIFSNLYASGFKSGSSVFRSLEYMNINSINEIDRNLDAVYLVLKKNEKFALINQGFKNVHTVGEYQGCQSPCVVLIRSTNYVGDDIYSKPSQVLVALTRHTKRLIYYTVVCDSIVEMINQAKARSQTELNAYSVGDFGGASVEDSRIVSESLVLRDNNPTVSIRTLSPTLQQYCTSSNFLTLTNRKYVKENIYVKSFFPSVTNPYGSNDYYLLQTFYDTVLPGNSLHFREFEQEICEMADMDLSVENVKLTLAKIRPMKPRKPHLHPVLRTSICENRQPTQIDSLLGLIKRNLTVPDLDGIVDESCIANVMIKRFMNTYIDMEIFKNFLAHPIFPNVGLLREWLENQPTCTQNQILGLTTISDYNLNEYILMNKNTLKPTLTTQAPYEYSSVQTIAYQDKDINAYFCPIFKEIRERIINCLKKKFAIFSDMSAEEFASLLTSRFPNGEIVYNGRKLEIDMSKYDKSQQSLILHFECLLYAIFGFPQEIISMWHSAHMSVVLQDFLNGVKAYIMYQRRSGDASTFIGNTLVLMGILATLFRMDWGFFSGDDSLLGITDDGQPIPDLNVLCGELFNMESKFFYYEYPYFCSKFLVFDNYRYYFVPDPIKLITKLGRHDLVNYDHADEYRVSSLDLTKGYDNHKVGELLTYAISERYNVRLGNVAIILSCIRRFLSSKSSFFSLYYTHEGEEELLSTDPSRPSLD
uniref:Polyprotein n=1 Tax=Suncus murinus ribovirus 2 TaxID=3139576 RepID=A0AB38ZKF6_9VIRU